MNRTCLIAVLVGTLGVARADTDHTRAGLALYQAGKYAEAAVELEAAYLEKPTTKVGFALAQSLRLAGNCTRALPFYREVLSQVSGEAKARVESGIRDCEQRETERRTEDAKRAEEERAAADRRAAEEAARADQKRRAEAAEQARAAQREQARIASERSAASERDRIAREQGHWYGDVLGGVLVGGGLVAGGTGGYFFYRARNHYRDATNADGETAFVDARSDGDRERRWGTIASAAGGGLILLGIIRYAYVGSRSAPATISLRSGPETMVFATFTF